MESIRAIKKSVLTSQDDESVHMLGDKYELHDLLGMGKSGGEVYLCKPYRGRLKAKVKDKLFPASYKNKSKGTELVRKPIILACKTIPVKLIMEDSKKK
jgi:hypothetical protein